MKQRTRDRSNLEGFVKAPSPRLTSLLLFVHFQVPSLAPVREIEATPKDCFEDEHDDEDEYDLGKKRKRAKEGQVTKGGTVQITYQAALDCLVDAILAQLQLHLSKSKSRQPRDRREQRQEP